MKGDTLKGRVHKAAEAGSAVYTGQWRDERVFTYNLRDRTDSERFSAVLGAVAGLRLTYAEATGQH